MQFSEEFNNTRKLIDETLTTFILPVKNTPQKNIYEAMAYSLDAGGKRIRPVLLLETMKMLDCDIETGIPFACALEYIHTYSLIHDDLPAMDNDDLRRGKPTNHIVFGEAVAILAGDGLLNSAFEIMANEVYDRPLESTVGAMKLITKCAGVNGMIAGQIVDMESENKKISYEELKYLHSKKTGALLKAAVMSGALLAQAKPDELKALDLYSENIGLAFQISDDILDVVGDSKLLGKNTGSDKSSQKSTYVSLFGIERAKALAEECLTNALNSLEMFDVNKRTFLEELARFIISREN